MCVDPNSADEENGTKLKRYSCSMKVETSKCFPILQWLPRYSLEDARGDAVAGLTVALLLVPQALAYASLASLPYPYGLYAGYIGPLVYCFLGTAKDITVGPTAIMSTLVGAAAPMQGCVSIDEDMNENYDDCIDIALSLTFLSGCFQLLLGALGAGFVVEFISNTVLEGFIAAAALSITVEQLPKLIGMTDHCRHTFTGGIIDMVSKIDSASLSVAGVGVCSLLLLEAMKRAKPTFPGNSIAAAVSLGRNAIIVVITFCVCYIGTEQGWDIPRPENIVSGLPAPGIPDFKKDARLAVSAVIIGCIGFLENIAIAKSFAKTNNYKVDGSQELIAIGGINILSSFFSSYPVTGSFSRTAVNSSSGVRTPMGGMVTSGVVIFALYVLTPLIQYIPKTALAAIIIPAVLTMPKLDIPLELWRNMPVELFGAYIPTFVACLWSLEYGILVGCGCSVLTVLYRISQPHIEVQVLPAVGEGGDRICVVTIEGHTSFLSRTAVQARLEGCVDDFSGDPDAPPLVALIIDIGLASRCGRTAQLDFTSIEMFGEVADKCQAKNISVTIVGAVEITQLNLSHAASFNHVKFAATMGEAKDDLAMDDLAGHRPHLDTPNTESKDLREPLLTRIASNQPR
ncbi:hypothetical protein CYMTET_53793 [Cymbomonas tetramitiformis]|uniref:SLC26A/SulP transporter domain-containing protein n=1 Tax=Cymbomonas tetramitiformis TaxID=36881 RepID=A0AAE0BHM9_9CHLO|nr:hypothetical protein CYMTET_53793 [Cymbomonas tetramitiformis]